MATSPPERPSRRRRRAVGVGALALLLLAAAGFAYLRSNTTATTKQTPGVPFTNPLLATPNPVRYDFVSPSLGWAVEIPLTQPNSVSQFHVFRTLDSGKHWQLQVTGQSSGPGFIPIAVQFFDRTHGYMALALAFTGEQVYRTSDGGDEWQAVQLPAPQSVVVRFSDASHALALAQPNPPTNQLFKLYATSDGGATWQRLPDPPRDAYYLEFRRPTEAWMGSLGQDSPHIYTSADVGRTWQRHDLPPPPGRTWDPGGYGTIVRLLPLVGAVAAAGGGIFTSFDTGGTWRYVPPPPGEVGYEDDFHWWAIKGTVLSKSSDAGQTWNEISKTLPDWQLVPYLHLDWL